MRYTVRADGTLVDGMLFCDATSDTRPGAPDGMKVRKEICTAPGKHLGTIDFPEKVANLAWGDADYKTLYVTASSSIYRIFLKIPGVYPQVH